jgi:hypothetical protein
MLLLRALHRIRATGVLLCSPWGLYAYEDIKVIRVHTELSRLSGILELYGLISHEGLLELIGLLKFFSRGYWAYYGYESY